MKKYTTKAGREQFMPSMEEAETMDSEGYGFCLACGNDCQPAEPDARKYVCDACGEEKVYGASELILMGLFY
jgi:predicted RNA-binding Zn-ribbon protein involved in translation (DUF1610 family)